MTLLSNHGPLIESGAIDGATYEVRGTTHPMIYVYRQDKGGYAFKSSQAGGTPINAAVRMLIAELPKVAA